ncbi:unnamed protein product [Didymodactylos carnosus]|uniref:Uncharacterized protein n=1 Tax=Didymodactylos carnosus TaxID=1234261 RepID=A0A814S8M7_9BILA|nr:unnamed protein product [Didymodactylos carnosus]CAF1467391.1 unnamed protein product [Didymodactylos carnosus]CAF3907371.1 unnamed protein product [Didymodactylos carnosus]CAF4259791.1 unnamed protein product [Didymodactylos carnosus]
MNSLNTGTEVRAAIKIVKWNPSVFPIGDMFRNMVKTSPYLSTTIFTASFIAVGTIQCIECAKRVGDFYPTRESIFADGIGTLAATFRMLAMLFLVFCQRKRWIEEREEELDHITTEERSQWNK